MNRLVLLLTLCGCAAVPPEQKLLAKALLRRGGEQIVRESGGVIRETTGTLYGIPYRSTLTYRDPNMLRLELEFVGLDMRIERVFDGKYSYQVGGAGVSGLQSDEARALRSQAMDETVFWLVGLEDPNLTVAFEEEPATFRGAAVETLRVGHWTGYSRLLHFDRETHDLIGAQGLKWFDAGRRPMEIVYSDFRIVEGVRLPLRFELYVDGKLTMDGHHERITFRGVPPADDFYLEQQGAAGFAGRPLPPAP